MATYEFATPRLPDSGLYYVQITVRDEDGANVGDVLRDERGHVRTFKTQADAWDAAKAWEIEQRDQP